MVLLSIKQVSKSISAKYLDYIDIFSKKSITKLPKCRNMNEYIIDLK